jgi:hypothetical protein
MLGGMPVAFCMGVGVEFWPFGMGPFLWLKGPEALGVADGGGVGVGASAESLLAAALAPFLLAEACEGKVQ